MTANHYLKTLRSIKWKIESCTREIERIENESGYDYQQSGIDYSRDKVMSSSGDNNYNPSIRRVDLIIKRRRLILELQNERDTIIDQIHSVAKHPHVEVMERFYVDGESLLDISYSMHLSYDRVRHIHSEALDLFAELYGLDNSTHNSTDT